MTFAPLCMPTGYKVGRRLHDVQETGDPAWFTGIAADALVMNLDDAACVGATTGFYLSNTIGRNAHRVDGACLAAVINGYTDLIERLAAYGISIVMTGGETADVGDLVRTMICDATVTVRLPRADVISASAIRPGLAIVGLSSTGQTDWEDKENSGISSNGLTAARHLLLHSDYRQLYPETWSETLVPSDAYSGTFYLNDRLPDSVLTIGEALLSPTRTYLPVLIPILGSFRTQIAALVHCTGGGQVKCGDFSSGIRYVKNNLFDVPPLFAALRQSGLVRPDESFRIFNMGHRMEVYCEPEIVADIIALCEAHRLDARQVGYTEAAATSRNEVVITDPMSQETYAWS